MVRAARGGRVPLRRPGACVLSRRTRTHCPTRSGPSTCSSATTPAACSRSGGCTPWDAAAGSTHPRHRHLPLPPRIPPRRAEGCVMSDIERDVPAPFRLPAGGRIDRGTTHRFTFGGTDADRPPRRHPGVGAARPRCAPDGHQHQAGSAPRDRGGVGGGPEQPRPGRGAVPRADAAGDHDRADRRARRARHPRPGAARRRGGLRPLRRPPRARRPARGGGGTDRPRPPR